MTTNINTTAAKKQSILAVSDEFKAFFANERAKFSLPGKADPSNLVCMSEREFGDAIMAFVESFRYEKITEEQIVPLLDDNGNPLLDDNGNPLEDLVEVEITVDRLALECKRTLALRGTISRIDSKTALMSRLTEAQKQAQATEAKLAESMARLAAMEAAAQAQNARLAAMEAAAQAQNA